MDLHETYLSIKPQVDKRLAEFKNKWRLGTNPEIFTEMVFCLCTPQTDAHKGWAAARELQDNILDEEQVAHVLRKHGVRFHHTKAKRIMEAVEDFRPDTHTILETFINLVGDSVELRDVFAENIKGWGLKEASHFLRNLGMGQKICILDRHILRRLKEHKVIGCIPKLSRKTYHDIEQKMIDFAHKVKIPVEALDLVFWYQSKGELFK
jgi:N-glycosylase/DNA lyase